jgi:hypothetical protein
VILRVTLTQKQNAFHWRALTNSCGRNAGTDEYCGGAGGGAAGGSVGDEYCDLNVTGGGARSDIHATGALIDIVPNVPSAGASA